MKYTFLHNLHYKEIQSTPRWKLADRVVKNYAEKQKVKQSKEWQAWPWWGIYSFPRVVVRSCSQPRQLKGTELCSLLVLGAELRLQGIESVVSFWRPWTRCCSVSSVTDWTVHPAKDARALSLVRVRVQSDQSCLTLCDPVDHSPPGSSVRGILQAWILKWVATPFSRRSSRPRDWTPVS